MVAGCSGCFGLRLKIDVRYAWVLVIAVDLCLITQFSVFCVVCGVVGLCGWQLGLLIVLLLNISLFGCWRIVYYDFVGFVMCLMCLMLAFRVRL